VSLEWDGGGPFAVSRAEAAELIGDPGAHLANTGASAWLDSGVSPILFYRVVETTCGNGQIDFGEECDDAAHANGDGCSARCTREAAGQWQRGIQDRIAERARLNHGLTGCIGCGRLSLDRCRYASPADRAGRRGPGRRYWTGDRPANDPTRKQRRRV
jgi:cysteine-rich repeat protein